MILSYSSQVTTAHKVGQLHMSDNEKVKPGRRSHIISGIQAGWVKRKFQFHILKLVIKHFGLTNKAIYVLDKLIEKQKLVHGTNVFNKWVRAGGKYYYYQYAPAFPSRQMDQVLLEEINRIEQVTPDRRSLRFAFFAITKKCPLKCEHCFEWDNINKKEILQIEDLRSIVLKLMGAGISMLHLSGGEPMLRVNDIVNLANEFSDRIEIWVLTSGFNCSEENIEKLKTSGIRGLVVSLDHYKQENHDRFRNHSGSYNEALTAIKNARVLDMPVAISLCATKSFCTKEHLYRYLELAHQLDVSFIQLLEPKAVGRYTNKDVTLEETQLQLLSGFYEEVNFSAIREKYPLVVYHGYYQRRVGCFSAGNRSLYVDTSGNVTSCPFCQCSSGNLLKDPLPEIISSMKQKGCGSFGASVL